MLWSFALVIGLLTPAPGFDTALIQRTVGLGCRTWAWGVVLGIQTGTLIWGALTSLGVTALLTASHVAHEVLRWAGAAYLLWMAAWVIRDTFRRARPTIDPAEARAGADTLVGGWRQGTVTDLLNPKMGVFHVAVLPQFIPAGTVLLDGAAADRRPHLTGPDLAECSDRLRNRAEHGLREPRARKILDRVTGTVIGVFALRLGLSG